MNELSVTQCDFAQPVEAVEYTGEPGQTGENMNGKAEIVSTCYIPFSAMQPDKRKGEAQKKEKAVMTRKAGQFKNEKKLTISELLESNVSDIDRKIEPVKVGTIPGYFYGANLTPAFYVNNGRTDSLKTDYESGGVLAVWDRLKKEPFAVKAFSQWGIAENSLLTGDMCSGIFRALTGGAAYNGFFNDFSEQELDYWIKATPLQLAKCTFGACMNTTGFKRGFAEPLHNAKLLQDFNELLVGGGKSTRGREPCLNYYDTDGNFLESYRPLFFSSHNKYEFSIRLDKRFFAIAGNDKNGYVANCRYIASFAGVYALCVVGRAALMAEGESGLPTAKSVARLYHALQASFALQSLIGFERQYSDRGVKATQVRLQGLGVNGLGIWQLFPSQVKKTCRGGLWVDWKQAGATIASAAKVFFKGLEVTGLLKESLPNRENLLIIKTEKPCWVDKGKAVWIACESLKDVQEREERKIKGVAQSSSKPCIENR